MNIFMVYHKFNFAYFSIIYLYASSTSNSFLHSSVKTSSITSPLLFAISYGIFENETREYFGI